MKANWGHLRNIFTIITAGALAVHPVPGRSSPQASRSSGFSPPPSSHRSGLPAGLWPPVPAPGSGCVSLRLQETHSLGRPGRAGHPRRFSLGLESKTRVDRADSAAGLANPLPMFNSPNLDQDLLGPFMTWPRGRQVRSSLGGDDGARGPR